MRKVLLTASLALAGSLSFSSVMAMGSDGAGYTAADLLSPCQEADNDARWGEAAETECEQFIMGYVSALRAIGAKESMGICAPEQNTADEVRWAFMRWVHASYSTRTRMSAQDAMLGTLKDTFPCE